MSAPVISRAWHLVARPDGVPKPSDFALRETTIDPLADGKVLVRNEFLSVDPYMRGRMNDVESYVPPFRLDQPMDGGAVGVVVDSRSEEFAVGEHVRHMLGWREHAVLRPADLTRVERNDLPVQQHRTGHRTAQSDIGHQQTTAAGRRAVSGKDLDRHQVRRAALMTLLDGSNTRKLLVALRTD